MCVRWQNVLEKDSDSCLNDPELQLHKHRHHQQIAINILRVRVHVLLYK